MGVGLAVVALIVTVMTLAKEALGRMEEPLRGAIQLISADLALLRTDAVAPAEELHDDLMDAENRVLAHAPNRS